MKRSERGFTFIELLVVTAIVALIAGAASMATFQVFNVSKRSDNHMTVIRQAQNAGYWISRDALMAEEVVTDNLTLPDFLILRWTEWDKDKKKPSIYHSVTYSFQDLSDGIGKLIRTHEINGEANVQTLVAEYIYYTPDDPENTTDTEATYNSPLLTVQIAASLEEANETREYRVWRRPDFYF